MEPLWTLVEVAEFLNVDEFTVYRLIHRKRLPAFKVGHQWRFKLEMVEKWLESHSNLAKPIKRRRQG